MIFSSPFPSYFPRLHTFLSSFLHDNYLDFVIINDCNTCYAYQSLTNTFALLNSLLPEPPCQQFSISPGMSNTLMLPTFAIPPLDILLPLLLRLKFKFSPYTASALAVVWNQLFLLSYIYWVLNEFIKIGNPHCKYKVCTTRIFKYYIGYEGVYKEVSIG